MYTHSHIEIRPARLSERASIAPKIQLVPISHIATYENISFENLLRVITAIIEKGYYGPPVAVTEVSEGLYGILDGHHRLAALSLLNVLGMLRGDTAPVQIMPIADERKVQIAVRNPSERPPSVAEVFACYRDAERFIPRGNTAHFRAALLDGSYERIAETQPDVIISRDALLRTDVLPRAKPRV